MFICVHKYKYKYKYIYIYYVFVWCVYAGMCFSSGEAVELFTLQRGRDGSLNSNKVFRIHRMLPYQLYHIKPSINLFPAVQLIDKETVHQSPNRCGGWSMQGVDRTAHIGSASQRGFTNELYSLPSLCLCSSKSKLSNECRHWLGPLYSLPAHWGRYVHFVKFLTFYGQKVWNLSNNNFKSGVIRPQKVVFVRAVSARVPVSRGLLLLKQVDFV